MAEESIQSVKRTFLVLESLAGRGSAGVRELHGVVGLSVATVHRILSTLVDLGYVRRNPQTERYELTYKILVLGHSVTQHSGVIQLAHPLLEQLSAQAGETVHFAERSGASIRYIDKVVPSTGVVVMSSYLGMELPLYSTAVGKAIMADLPADEVEEIWNRSDRIPYTPNTISAPEELRRQLEEVRASGVAYDWEERELGISCVAVDILDVTGKPVYAVSFSSSNARMKENQLRYTALVKEIKAQLTSLIGYSVAQPGQR